MTSPTSIESIASHSVGKLYSLPGIRDYNGNPHANPSASDKVKQSYKLQGRVDVNKDRIMEAIYTNKESGRWVTASVDPLTGNIDYSKNGKGGTTRVVGIYIDPLVKEGIDNGGFLRNGQAAPRQGGPFDSQRRFQNDLQNDNLILRAAGDYDRDGFQEVYWKTADGTSYLRAIMHADGNIQYANYQSAQQLTDYLNSTGNANAISTITGNPSPTSTNSSQINTSVSPTQPISSSTSFYDDALRTGFGTSRPGTDLSGLSKTSFVMDGREWVSRDF